MKSFDQLLTPARLKRIEAFGLTVEQAKELIFHTAPSTDVTVAGASVPVSDTIVGDVSMSGVAIGSAIGGTIAGIAAVVVAVGAYIMLSDAQSKIQLGKDEALRAQAEAQSKIQLVKDEALRAQAEAQNAKYEVIEAQIDAQQANEDLKIMKMENDMFTRLMDLRSEAPATQSSKDWVDNKLAALKM